MKISVFYHHIAEAAKQQGASVRELLPQISQMGIEAVDIDYNTLNENKAQICSELDICGIKICSVYRIFTPGRDFTEDEILRTVSLCHEAGADSLLIVPGLLDENEKDALQAACKSYEATNKYFTGSRQIGEIKSLLEYAVATGESRQINICLEDFDNSLSPCQSGIQLLWWVKNVPGLKIAFDTGNFAFCNENPEETFRLLKNYIVHMHCKDRGINKNAEQTEFCKGLEPSEFGGGYLPVGSIVSALKNSGYNGYYSIEHYGVNDYFSAIKKSAEYIAGLA